MRLSQLSQLSAQRLNRRDIKTEAQRNILQPRQDRAHCISYKRSGQPGIGSGHISQRPGSDLRRHPFGMEHCKIVTSQLVGIEQRAVSFALAAHRICQRAKNPKMFSLHPCKHRIQSG